MKLSLTGFEVQSYGEFVFLVWVPHAWVSCCGVSSSGFSVFGFPSLFAVSLIGGLFLTHISAPLTVFDVASFL